MRRIAGPLLAFALALANAPANAQAGATPATSDNRLNAPPSTAIELDEPSAQPATVDDICRALEQSAAENALPVEFFARVIWQESRFDARAISPKGAQGIAQFMPATASWHGLADPFEPVEALRHSAAYLRELLNRIGNLGLAAAAYNAGPARVSAWLTIHGQLRGSCDWLDGGRVGVVLAARKGRYHDSTRRALHSARQFDPRTEAREAAHRSVHTALGHSTGRSFV
jgi:soluble lytic murein transglycosylase-like protein